MEEHPGDGTAAEESVTEEEPKHFCRLTNLQGYVGVGNDKKKGSPQKWQEGEEAVKGGKEGRREWMQEGKEEGIPDDFSCFAWRKDGLNVDI
jgi:hypothetical protein